MIKFGSFEGKHKDSHGSEGDWGIKTKNSSGKVALLVIQVGMAGFEPGTLCSRNLCNNKKQEYTFTVRLYCRLNHQGHKMKLVDTCSTDTLIFPGRKGSLWVFIHKSSPKRKFIFFRRGLRIPFSSLSSKSMKTPRLIRRTAFSEQHSCP